MDKQPKRPRGRPLAVVTVPQVAELHGVRPSTIRMAIYAGRLPAVRQGRVWLVKRADAERWKKNPNSGPRKVKGECDE